MALKRPCVCIVPELAHATTGLCRWQGSLRRHLKLIHPCMTRRVGVTDPERFQVEIQFSAGAAYDPFGLAPSQPHVLPIRPRFPLFQGVLCVTPSVGVKPQYKWVDHLHR